MAGLVSRLLDPTRIALHVRSPRRAAALEEVARLLAGHPDVVNFDGFYGDLLARDRLDTTCLGNGIALPHARTDHVKAIVLAVGRSDGGIEFEAGQDPVRLLFVLGTPTNQPGDYLQVVSALCRVLKSDSDCAALLAAGSAEEFVRTVTAIEERMRPPS